MTLKDKWVIPNRLLPLNSRARFSPITEVLTRLLRRHYAGQ